MKTLKEKKQTIFFRKKGRSLFLNNGNGIIIGRL